MTVELSGANRPVASDGPRLRPGAGRLGLILTAFRLLASATFVALFVGFAPAQADIGSTSVVSTGATTANVTLNHPGFTAVTNEYKLCWKVSGQWGNPCLHNSETAQATGPNPTVNINLAVGMTYVIGGKCKCTSDSGLNLTSWRDIDSTTYVHALPSPPLLPGPIVRLRNTSTNQCLYAGNGLGRHWGCWADPNMRFELLTLQPNVYALKHIQSGTCLATSVSPSGVAMAPCGSRRTRLAKIDVGGGLVQLRLLSGWRPFSSAGGCLYTQNTDGGYVQRAPCSSHPRYTFSLDPA